MLAMRVYFIYLFSCFWFFYINFLVFVREENVNHLGLMVFWMTGGIMHSGKQMKSGVPHEAEQRAVVCV